MIRGIVTDSATLGLVAAATYGASDFVGGLLAGLGFGIQFSALGQIPMESGLAPLAMSQALSLVAIVAGDACLGAPWAPRDRSSRHGVFAGILAGTATLAYRLAAQTGHRTVAAVVTSLYSAATVLIASVVLRERTTVNQAVGLALAGTAVVLIAAG